MSSPESDSTPQSFIENLACDRSTLNWERFLFLYRPLLERWLRLYGISPTDAPDLIQESLVVVVRRLPEFRHNGRTGAFRTWLKQILRNQVLEHRRREQRISSSSEIEETLQIEDPRGGLELLWDREHDREILRRLLQLTKPLVPAKSWEAFYRTAVMGDESPAVAKELGMSLNAVYIARSRVFGQLRRLARGLLATTEDEDEP